MTINKNSVLISIVLLLFGLAGASDENGTFNQTTQIITFKVDQPCSVVIRFDITPRIQCFYKNETRLSADPSHTAKNGPMENSQSTEFIVNDPVDERKMAETILKLINTERTNYGLNPLTWNEKVYRAAVRHSQDMNNCDYFAHESPEGLEPKDRLSAQKTAFTCCGECIYMINMLVENICQNVVNGWMNSFGHRAIILDSFFNEGAVGIWVGEKNNYFTFDCITGE